jgi:hypothetical protein
MRSASKFWLVAALALAAMALAAGPAFATTITPAGDARGEAGPGNLNNGIISITCQSSVAVANLATNGDTSINSLTFADCTEDISGATCTVVVDGLPQLAATTHDGFPGSNRGVLALTGPPFAGANVDCGTLQCRADSDERLRGEVIGGDGTTPETRPVLRIVNQPIAVSGDIGCGVGLDGAWNSEWAVTGTGGPGDGTYPRTDLTIAE